MDRTHPDSGHPFTPGPAMTRGDVIRIAIECQLVTTGNRDGLYMDALVRFAALVAAHEREECARACKDIPSGWVGDTWVAASTRCADAIRARGNNE